MLDEPETNSNPSAATPRRRAAGRPAGPPKMSTDIFSAPARPAAKAKNPPRAGGAPATKPETTKDQTAAKPETAVKAQAPKTVKKAAVKKAPAKKAAESSDAPKGDEKPTKTTAKNPPRAGGAPTPAKKAANRAAGPTIAAALFQAPENVDPPPRKKAARAGTAPTAPKDDDGAPKGNDSGNTNANAQANNRGNDNDDDNDDDGPRRRRRSRGGRRRRKSDNDDQGESSDNASANDDSGNNDEDGNNPTLRRRRRRRAGDGSDGSPDDPENTVVRVREPRSAEDEITGLSGSTRLEAKKQRRREGREAGRRRAPIVSEAEFLARREAVKREMVIRQRTDFTQIAVLEDDVLVEHYVARESQTSLIGNVYLGRVQNVLPSMEAAFVDIGKGRNAVLYAGEVDWTTLGNGKQRKIEDVLKSGQTVLVQVTKDPVGQKGARLTSQVSLAGRFLVYVPGGQTSGISRKLPDTERTRLKNLLKEVLPEEAGVIVRTAAEGATEEQLTRDVTALTARWEDIERKVEAGKSPELLYGEPDLMIKVVRDLFNEDFNTLVVEGDDAWDMVSGYIDHVAPDLIGRLERWEDKDKDSFTGHRIGEQISKALERKVYLPSGGSLVIDRTEAMTVVDVNTGKFTGSGGNLEETVTKNNLEAAEEIVRQLRLRDIGGIIVIDFIDMVLENNRDLVLRRLVECLGRDRTRHQVAEVTSLGLVQMTRKRIGTGLVEAFSEDCDHCHGRGVVIRDEPVEPKNSDDGNQRRNRRGSGRNNAAGGNNNSGGSQRGKQKSDDKAEQKPDDKAPATSSDAQTGVRAEDHTEAAVAPPTKAPTPATQAEEVGADDPKAAPEASETGADAADSGASGGPVLTAEGNAP